MMKSITPFHFVAAFASIVAAVPPALADAGHDHGSFAFGKPGQAENVDRTIELAVNEMSFGIEKLEVKAGETIRFVIHNGSEIEHDFTLGDHATQEAHRAEMMKMMESDSGMMSHDDANAVFLAPGETKQLIWTFSKPGDFEFACNVPGHYEAGMHGPITVPDAS